jgi:surface protein
MMDAKNTQDATETVEQNPAASHAEPREDKPEGSESEAEFEPETDYQPQSDGRSWQYPRDDPAPIPTLAVLYKTGLFEIGPAKRGILEPLVNQKWVFDSTESLVSYSPSETGVLDIRTPWTPWAHKVRRAVVLPGTEATSTAGWFAHMGNMRKIDLSGLSSEYVIEDLSCMFYGCSSLKCIDARRLANIDPVPTPGMFFGCASLMQVRFPWTLHPSDAFAMFCGCSSLEALDVSNLFMADCTSMRSMFRGCSSLKSVDASQFNTLNCTDMSSMFQDCSSLTFLDVSDFNMRNCTDMSRMFFRCSSLKSLCTSGFNTAACVDMGEMFAGCSSLGSLDVSHFDTSACRRMKDMLSGCDLTKVRGASGLDTSSCDDDMRESYLSGSRRD